MAAPANQLPRHVIRRGARAALRDELRILGVERAWVATDPGLVAVGVLNQVVEALGDMPHAVYAEMAENPTVPGVDAAVAHFREARCDGIVALGGGSVIDAAKGVALLGTHTGSMADFLGRPEHIRRAPIPLVAMPTTAGSGSEASPAAGIHPTQQSRAIGTRSHFLVPRATIGDPELTRSLPALLTAATGLDALGHCFEGFLAATHAPLLDGMALSGMRRIAVFLPRAVVDGTDLEAREQMLCAAWEGGAAIGKGLGPAHALANSLGDRGLHHGMLVAASLPPVLDFWAAHRPEALAVVGDALGIRSQPLAQWFQHFADRIGLALEVPAAPFAGTSRDEIAADAAGSPFNRTCSVAPTTADYRRWLDAVLVG